MIVNVVAHDEHEQLLAAFDIEMEHLPVGNYIKWQGELYSIWDTTLVIQGEEGNLTTFYRVTMGRYVH